MIRGSCLAVLTILTCLTATPAAAQPVLQDTPVVELDTVYPGVHLGNRDVLVGLTLTEQDVTADPTRLLIYLPPYRGDSLCVNVVSYDGLYRGRFRYGRYDSVGWQILVLPTKHADLLRSYRPNQLAPLVHISPACAGEVKQALPAGWGPQPRTVGFRLLLNPQRVRRVTAEWSGFPASRCGELARGTAFVFRYQCELPGGAASTELRTMTIRQTPGRGRRPIPAIDVQVWVPR